MFLKYTPDGGDEQKWTFKLGKLRSMETEAIEKLTGLDYGVPFKQALMQGNTRARRALLYTFLRRQHPTIRFADVDFADDELVLDMDVEEWQEMRAEVERSTTVDESTKAEVLAAIDASIAEADPAPGKALEKTDESATASP